MSPGPDVAVIIGDYSRRSYIRAALRSLASSTLPRDRYEVVVTKNYRDAELDRELSADGVIVLYDEEPRIGRWLRHAVNASRAPVVTFLDDDDETEPDRLARIVEVFGRYPDLGLYRNRVTVIDRQGTPIPPALWRPHERDEAFDRLGALYLPVPEKGRLFDLATRTTHCTFNTSSIALRRELLDGDLGDGFEATQLEDLYLFLTGVLAPRAVFLDDRRLTRFRFYSGNVSRQVRWLGHAEYSYRDMAVIARRHGRADFAEWLGRQSVHYGRMFRGSTLVERVAEGAGRREIAGRTGDYLRFLARHPEERAATLDTWAAGIYGLSYVGWPAATARLARTRLTARGLA